MLEICLPLSNKERYVGLTNIIIPNIVENYNEYIPFRVNMGPEKIRKIIEKIKLLRMKDKHLEVVKNLIKREIKTLNTKEKM